MADIKVSELPDGGRFRNGDVMHVIRAGQDFKVVRSIAGATAHEEGNALLTLLTVQGQYELVNCSLSLSAAQNFTVSGGVFTYVGIPQQAAVIWWNFSVFVGAGGVTESFAAKVHVNGAPIPGRSRLEPDVDDYANGSLFAYLPTIDNGDEIELRVANLDGVKDIMFTDQTVAIRAD